MIAYRPRTIHDNQVVLKSMTEDNAHESLEGATRDELVSCIQLLALSVVEHRAKCSFVPVRESTDTLRSGPNGTEDSGLFVHGKKVLEEALEMVRILAAEPTQVAEDTPGPLTAENRKQFRINVRAPVKVRWPGDSDPVEGELENISWGGAAIHVDQVKVSGDDSLHIILPSTRGGSISIEAKILRTWELADGKGHGIATRFSSLSTSDEEELENVLELLAMSADGEGQRKYARLTQRLDIQFDGIQELQATLDDISAGGLGITIPDPLQIGQSLQAVISTLDESCSLKLRARVVRQEAVKLGNIEVYQAGLKFEHPSEELNARTQELILKMAVMTKSSNHQD
jgi:c-di-GMP-binding flagellar brake protein YcgR